MYSGMTDPTANDNIHIYVKNNSIIIESDSNAIVSIFNINGTLVKNIDIKRGMIEPVDIVMTAGVSIS